MKTKLNTLERSNRHGVLIKIPVRENRVFI